MATLTVIRERRLVDPSTLSPRSGAAILRKKLLAAGFEVIVFSIPSTGLLVVSGIHAERGQAAASWGDGKTAGGLIHPRGEAKRGVSSTELKTWIG